ncbi:HypC/HybG/HupF family hydrogenase formation chaperone [Paenibacillus thiaminolyticus]|uniref:HypC/HybG/HupF family hydrogenase formation chaperone n=1 Tax=Paenibacillus thiaminolyticus TaxID=49283 RepID=A0ABT4G3K2_PANTH|nr:HypC/HybG/HupF family hydrogenase formation chaperone [Paenibacillus thiaminolyticus]MCY9538018.1 HypC/HybG/HupF family hydrogenase formation chaperone [Paenibacillus thiaminolyticus]MCY9604916.1 HypC/HybG/HupF family hydrogenase formation chaperone [Paenibacillus thiaminolyticus]MCY9610651.1 HypC/HybG/HupF family hydrogenase formation chaperone [Paenibacillus thiaminolyticus]MCY9615979.1 HypC/HybG/HupF family hydrogenase formation chaperone [Paenibacillus thiaminolyticus]MCY9622385.1 HypC/
MCLSVPAQVLEVYPKDWEAKVDYLGARFMVGIRLLEQVNPGEYVLVHAGEAIQIVDEEKALDGLALWKEMLAEP